MRRSAIAAVMALVLTGCAHGPEPDSGAPDFTPIVGEPAPPQARFYADCIAASVAAGAYRRARDPDTELILFTCTGAPARAFYEGLAARSAAIGSEIVVGGRTLRSTNRVNADLFGVDWCATDGVGGHECVISLNAGPFLAE